MFLNIGKRFVWLAGLALVPVVEGQEIIRHPQNQTVCVGDSAVFVTETIGDSTEWLFNGTLRSHLPAEERDLTEIIEDINTPENIYQEILTINYNEAFFGLKVQSAVWKIGGSSVNSTAAYLFYQTNQKFPATGLTATANGTAIQAEWESKASEVRTQYLVSISNVTETPAVVSSPHYTYLPESQNCQWYEVMVTAHQCFDATELDISQTAAASVRVAYPNISPVTAQFDNNDSKTVLLNWVSAGDSTNYWVSITDLDRGDQIQTVDDDPPFSYTPARCGEYNLNVSVSPAECAEDPGFTQSETIRFTIPCPTTATEATETDAEITGQPSGTTHNSSSMLPVIAAAAMLVRHYFYE